MTTDSGFRRWLRDFWDGWLWLLLPESMFRRLRDRCQVCFGTRGGVRGNENVIEVEGHKVVMCDYCSSIDKLYPGTSARILRLANGQ